jgi:hypothetical protein
VTEAAKMITNLLYKPLTGKYNIHGSLARNR